MGDGPAEAAASAHEHTPLSGLFRDSAFTSFVNEADDRARNASRAAGESPDSHAQKHRGAPLPLPPPGGGQGPAGKHGPALAPQQPPAKPAPLAGGGNNLGATDDNDGDKDDNWDELDDLELDSQTMRQLVEAEEQFYATQQFMAPIDLPLSQELSGTRAVGGARSFVRCTSAGGGHDQLSARTVPSPMAQSVPVTPTSAPLAYTSDSDASARLSSGGPAAVRGQRAIEPGGRTPDPSHWPPPGQQQQQAGMVRRKTNLLPHLAAHMPPRLGDRPHGPRPPPPPPPPPGNRLASHPPPHRGPSITHGSDVRFDVGTSALLSPSRLNPGQAAGARRPMLQGPDTSGVLDELKRLREENARMRADHEALQSRLYTKEGEVKIVRENLARTEIENTHLQERLANQIAASAASQAQVEASLKAEVERLRTELRFQQHEAKTVATPGARTPVQRTAAARCGAGTPGTPGSASAPSGYPSLADFHSTPTAPASRAESTPTKLRGRQAAEQLARGDRPTDETPAQLLAILAGIAERPGAEPGRLMRLAVRLAETARDRRPEAIDEFHAQACAAVDRALGTGRFGLLAAVLRLLVQTAETLPAIRARWLADAPGGPLRAQQVAAAARRALEASVAAAAAMRAGSDESAACGEAIAAQVELLLRVAAHQPAAALGGSAWAEFRPCELAAHFGAGLPLGGLGAVLKLLAALIRASPPAWARLRDDPPRFQQLLLAALRRLRAAFVAGEPQMLETHRNLLVLVAAAVVVHEDDSRALINAMPQFTVALVHWLLDEHAVLVALHARRPVDRRRAAVFCEHTKCLSVVLSEVADVPALLGGDSSPLFFAFVAAATRMTLGQAPLADQPDIHEVAADLLAYVVTEDQAVAIQGLTDFA